MRHKKIPLVGVVLLMTLFYYFSFYLLTEFSFNQKRQVKPESGMKSPYGLASQFSSTRSVLSLCDPELLFYGP